MRKMEAPLGDRLNWSPRSGLRLSLAEAERLRGGAGRGSQHLPRPRAALPLHQPGGRGRSRPGSQERGARTRVCACVCARVCACSGLLGPTLQGCVLRVPRGHGRLRHSASREHKQGEEAGVSAWARCQRAGAGTQCPGRERAGGREREQPDSAAGPERGRLSPPGTGATSSRHPRVRRTEERQATARLAPPSPAHAGSPLEVSECLVTVSYRSKPLQRRGDPLLLSPPLKIGQADTSTALNLLSSWGHRLWPSEVWPFSGC
ncbi:uncharacterized protein LOC132648410 [Meriones unguiculatus]|uniref:uncharacterized protein LOC132648410 n=1 Tax=Meriones unguiculatus TaxID=10047 RepID=UPI00293F660A|nr:uncharacterized protein LOC132648410 [Meriones unguiculatus]